MSDYEQFRQQTRAWLEANCPPKMREPLAAGEDICPGGRNYQFKSDDERLWLERMAARGWTAPDWPAEYGGGGLDRRECGILQEEMGRINARPPLASFGVWMLGPALLKFASEEHKQRFLPPIVRGEIRWCQGYSEPGSGSDLASLATSAVDKDDHYLVNGQKVWTSYADKADWIFCLVRTDPKAKKHEGISLLLFDMECEGVEARPIKLISGASPFCETFFTDVKVPKDQLVGEINKGWTIAKYLLTHEREMIGGMGLTAPLTDLLADVLDGDTPVAMRAEIEKFEVDDWAFTQAMQRILGEAKAGESVGAQSAVLKYMGTELNKRRHELIMAARGFDALEWESERSSGGSWSRDWLRSKGNSIEGGTSEVQLNVIAKRILELPGA